MVVTTVRVPAALVGRVHRSAMALYAVSSDALQHEAQAHRACADSVEKIRRRRSELAVFASLVERLGWKLGEPRGEVVITAEARLLRETLGGALLDAFDDVDASCRGYVLGDASIDPVRRGLDELSGLLDLLGGLEAATREQRRGADGS